MLTPGHACQHSARSDHCFTTQIFIPDAVAASGSDVSSVLIIDWYIRKRRAVIQSGCRAQVSRLDEEKNALVARASQFQSSCMALGTQLKEARDRWQATCLTNAALQRELMALRAQAHEWQVRSC